MDTLQDIFSGITKNIWIIAGMIGIDFARNYLIASPMVAGVVTDAYTRSAIVEGIADVAKFETYGVLGQKEHHK